MTHPLIAKTQIASQQWQTFFNQGDAAGCASMYEKNATMAVKPFGEFKGTNEIRTFWQGLISQGLAQVRYIMPSIELLDEKSTLLTSGWQMNNAQGTITKEIWTLQDDGAMLLSEDNFEAQS